MRDARQKRVEFETKLEDYKFKLLRRDRRDEASLETEGSEFIYWNIKIDQLKQGKV